MGNSLHVYANHNLIFKGKELEEIAGEIRQKLELLELPNIDFIRTYNLWFAGTEPSDVKRVRNIKTKTHWSYDLATYNIYENGEITFKGPLGLEIDIGPHHLGFWNPPMRFWQWFNNENEMFRNEWRKYFCTVTKHFGGDKTVYTGEHGVFDEFEEFNHPFDEEVQILEKKLGPPLLNFNQIDGDNYYDTFFLDRFEDINWELNHPLEQYLPEPTDESPTDFDINEFQTREQLQKIRFDDELLWHKKIAGKIHFYHLAQWQGLICKHTGIVGGEDKIEVVIDKHAPFLYDELADEIGNQGYGHGLLNDYLFRTEISSDYIPELRELFEKFERELLWNGIGYVGATNFKFSTHGAEWFSVVSIDMALPIFLELIKSVEIQFNFEIVYSEATDDEYFMNPENRDKEYIIYKQ